MLLPWKTIALSLIGLLLLLSGITTYTLVQADRELPLAPVTLNQPMAVNLAEALHSVTTPADLVATFPYRAYLSTGTLPDLRQLGHDAKLLDSLYPADRRLNERLLYTAWTDSLAARQRLTPLADSDAYLLHTLRWAEGLPVAASFDPPRAMLYHALNTYWVQRVALALGARYRHNPNTKYSFRFRYLNQLCRDARCGVPVAYSGPEKVVRSFTEGRWSYLLTKFWRDADASTQAGAGLLGTLFLLPLLGWIISARRRH